MTIHVKFHEDSDCILVDVDWFCSEFCYRDAGHTETGAYPCGEESDSCTYCAHCKDVIRHGITECWHCVECEEYRYDDARVEAGMKCSECAYALA